MQRLLVLLAIVSSGCTYPGSLVSVCEGDYAINDTRILGQWRGSEEPEEELEPERKRAISIEISIERKPMELDVATVAPSEYEFVFRGSSNSVRLRGKLTKIAKNTYIELQQPPFDDRSLNATTIRPYFLIRYITESDKLRLTGASVKAYRDALNSSDLPVVETDSQTIYAGTVTELREFLAENGGDLYTPQPHDLIFRRSEKGNDE